MYYIIRKSRKIYLYEKDILKFGLDINMIRIRGKLGEPINLKSKRGKKESDVKMLCTT